MFSGNHTQRTLREQKVRESPENGVGEVMVEVGDQFSGLLWAVLCLFPDVLWMMPNSENMVPLQRMIERTPENEVENAQSFLTHPFSGFWGFSGSCHQRTPREAICAFVSCCSGGNPENLCSGQRILSPWYYNKIALSPFSQCSLSHLWLLQAT
jgi:hypothetical protein